MSLRRLEPVQWGLIAGSVAVLVWSVPGLFVNPDFSTGSEAPHSSQGIYAGWGIDPNTADSETSDRHRQLPASRRPPK